MDHFIETSLSKPLRYPGIRLNFDELENDIVGNTFIYAILEFDSEDLDAFKQSAMKRDFNTAISLGLYRLVERGWTCSIHDKDFIRFEYVNEH